MKRKLSEKSEKKRKKVKKSEKKWKKWKKRKKSEKSEKNEKIDLNFASLCFASKQKLLNRSEAKNLKRKKSKFYSEIVKHMWNGSKFALFRL